MKTAHKWQIGFFIIMSTLLVGAVVLGPSPAPESGITKSAAIPAVILIVAIFSFAFSAFFGEE